MFLGLKNVGENGLHELEYIFVFIAGAGTVRNSRKTKLDAASDLTYRHF